ncbi:hypothetical protein EV421DRAFT_512944 [Armillaria borealis]|uniref:Uncharacterized protein n=1 Tax=Armillaria borealis TaxID=47425 RepID=A0AA39JM16_9AGAR|nr:hypothetical protein EV421DRAFT_512944 [Armillaria borealis]
MTLMPCATFLRSGSPSVVRHGTQLPMNSMHGLERMDVRHVQQSLSRRNLNRYVSILLNILIVTDSSYTQLVKTSKPTGDAECPPHVERAHEIEDLMNEKAGSRDLDDEDIVDVDNDLESSDEENIPVKKNTAAVQPQVRGPVARRPATDCLAGSVNTGPRRRNNAQDILQNISSVLSPDAQMARSEEFSTRSMQTTQIFTLSSQNRDLQNRIDRLQSDLAAAERACNEAERRADRAEMMSMLHESSRGRRMTPPRRDNHVYQEVRYSDGGRARQCVDLDSPSAYDLLSGNLDSPNTRRYTIHSADHDDDEASIRPSSPAFQSAASGLNHMLEMPEHSGGTDSPPASSSSPFTST